MTSTSVPLLSSSTKFGKNLFQRKISNTEAELATSIAGDTDVSMATSLAPDDYDYNPFYIGNASQEQMHFNKPVAPIINDNFNPYYEPKPSHVKEAPSRRQMINEMLEEMQRMSTNPAAATECTSGGVCCGTGDTESASNHDDSGYATFSVKVGDDGRSDANNAHQAVSGIACGGDEPMDLERTGFASFATGSAALPIVSVNSGAAATSSASTSSDIKGGGFASQASEASIRVESRLLRFLRDPKLTEFRFEGRMPPAERRAVKWFAKERGLFFKEVAFRDHDRAYVVKKPFAMAREQQAKQREAERQEQRDEARRLLAESANKDTAGNKDAHTNGNSPMVSASTSEGLATFSVKAGSRETAKVVCSNACVETEPDPRPGFAAPRNRRDNWCQTISEENFLCYVCQSEVPLVIKQVHIASCLAQLRTQLRQDKAEADQMCEQLVRRQAELKRHKRPGDKRKVVMRQAIEEDKARLAERFIDMQQKRSLLDGVGGKPRTDAASAGLHRLDKVRPFESVHANDFQRLLIEAKQLDRVCSVRECGGQVADSDASCGACGRRFCSSHLDGPLHGCCRKTGTVAAPDSGSGRGRGAVSSAPTKFERDRLRQGLRDRLAIMAERRK